MPLPSQIDVIITQELLLRSGGYTEPEECPLSTCIRDALRGSLDGEILISVGTRIVAVFCSEGLHSYVLDEPYHHENHERVSHNNEIFQTIAHLVNNAPMMPINEQVLANLINNS